MNKMHSIMCNDHRIDVEFVSGKGIRLVFEGIECRPFSYQPIVYKLPEGNMFEAHVTLSGPTKMALQSGVIMLIDNKKVYPA